MIKNHYFATAVGVGLSFVLEAFSLNYLLYADMSQRVMNTIESLCPVVEVYSIDEAFL